MSIKHFLSHLADAAPGFRCYDCRDDSESLKLLAVVSHQLGPPALPEELLQIDKLLGKCAVEFKELYQHCNGCVLYRDDKSDAAGLEFYPVSAWLDRSAEMREEFQDMGWEEDELPEWLVRGTVFAEIPQSGNYFVIDPHGDEGPAIYYADHDDLEYEPFADSLTELLDDLIRDPAEFFLSYGCYTRYSDGKSKKQWIPKEYVSDVNVKSR